MFKNDPINKDIKYENRSYLKIWSKLVKKNCHNTRQLWKIINSKVGKTKKQMTQLISY